MKARLLTASLLVAPAMLVAMATNGHAASPQGTVSFAGRVTITPSSPGSANVCFSPDISCADSIGSAFGIANTRPVTGMVGSLSYDDACTVAVAYDPVSVGSLDVELIGAGVPLTAKWQRYGLVAVFTGTDQTVAGAAVMAPAPHPVAAPTCGAPVDLVISGALAFV